MTVIGRWPQTVEVCMDCGEIVGAIRHGQHPVARVAVVPSWFLDHQQPPGAVDLKAATDRVMALMIREYGAGRSEETREQAERLARVALGGQ